MLKDQLANYFNTESEHAFIGSKELQDKAEQIKVDLGITSELTRNWFNSFYKTYGIAINQQKFVKLKVRIFSITNLNGVNILLSFDFELFLRCIS